MTMLSLKINGEDITADVEHRLSLADFIRDHRRLTGTHLGCEHGVCGACTVLMDGEPIRSCITLAAVADETEITTIEALGAGGLHAVQRAWLEEQVPQCGYCQSGQLMAAAALLHYNTQPTDAEIDQAMSNICRCGTYPRIRKAIRRAAELQTQEA